LQRPDRYRVKAYRGRGDRTASRLRSIAGMLGGAGRQIAIDVAARVVEHQIGMG
jgi:hypothetical protein